MPTENNKQPVVDGVTPVGFRVLIKNYEKPNETSSGFILPEQENKGLPVLGQILIEGKKTFWERLSVFFRMKPKYKVGEWVYFRRYSVDELILETPNGKLNLFILEEAEIISKATMK